MLIDKGANVNIRGEDGWTALLAACARGHTDIIMTLLDKGAEVNARLSSGKTVLMMAAERCNSKVVQAILDKRGDATTKDSDGSTALIYAENGRDDLPKEEVLTLLRAAIERQSKPWWKIW